MFKLCDEGHVRKLIKAIMYIFTSETLKGKMPFILNENIASYRKSNRGVIDETTGFVPRDKQRCCN